MTGDMFPEARVDPAADPDKRYTLRETMDLCKRLAGVDRWDLDAAADQESSWSWNWYGIKENGLAKEWSGRVWCNPPYSNVEAWVRKAWAEVDRGDCEVIAMLLPANRTEQPFWSELIEPWRDGRAKGTPGGRFGSARILSTHFLPGRARFGHPGNPKGVGVGSPPFGCVLLVWKVPFAGEG